MADENIGEGSSSKPEVSEPAKKKLRSSIKESLDEKLEHRLGGILCCAVCLDLPKTAIYQCSNGHLMCAGCFTHVLADARLRDETATCPNCRIEISKLTSSRNLAVEKAVSELPAECQFCTKEFPRNVLDHHELELCEERLTSCKFFRIGCQWRGPRHEMQAHQAFCVHPSKSGSEVMEALTVIDVKQMEEQALYSKIFELLSFEKITFNDLQLKPYRTDEFIQKLYYETSRFTALNNQWVVKARINDNQTDPIQTCERSFSYQLILKSKINGTLSVYYLILRGPFGEMKVNSKIYYHEYTDENNASPQCQIPLHDHAECNKLLATKVINFRLIIFQIVK